MLKQFIYQNVHYWCVGRSYFGYHIYTTGFFLVDGLLIDCGPPNARRLLAPIFHEIKPGKVVITHHHEDHSGNASDLRDRGFSVLAHPAATAALESVVREIPFYRNVVWGRPKPVQFETIEESVDRFQVIRTPGHSEDHICLFEPDQKWLFTGDLYLASYLRYLRLDEDVFALMDSLRRLIALRPSVVFCNHRGIVEKGTEVLEKKLTFLEELRDKVSRAVKEGVPIKELRRKLFPSDYWFRYFSAGEFSTQNLVRAFAHPPFSAQTRGTQSRAHPGT